VVEDGSLREIRAAGDVVRFEAQAGALRATAEFSISSRGGCHVSKLAGPDTVGAEFLPSQAGGPLPAYPRHPPAISCTDPPGSRPQLHHPARHLLPE
jgi:hypothetical protein